MSCREEPKCCIPQESFLGPALCTVYINDLTLNCKTLDSILFADDKNLTAVRMQAVEAEPKLRNISRCLNSNKVVLILDKTVLIVVITAANASKNFSFVYSGKTCL